MNRIASGSIPDTYASTAALQEIIFWFFNRDMPRELIQATNALTHISNIRWIDLSPDICLTASMLIKEYNINPLDAYHAPTALFEDKMILSTEHVYDRIKGIKRIDPENYAKNCKGSSPNHPLEGAGAHPSEGDKRCYELHAQS